MFLTILSFVIVIGVVIFVHELGHFLAAKLVGIRVLTFSLGFPPKMVGKKIGETEYRICWIPLGGYVRMAGIVDESLESEDATQRPSWEFESKRAWQKALVISAGVLMNILLAMVIFSFLTAVSGIPEAVDQSVIGSVTAGTPAEQAGLRTDDRIIELNGTPVNTWGDITRLAPTLSEEAELEVVWERDGETLSNHATLQGTIPLAEGELWDAARIGIGQKIVSHPATPVQVLTSGPVITWHHIGMAAWNLQQLVTGEVAVRDLAGPVSIARMSGSRARSGVLDFISFIGFISVHIGFINILPFPVLDGGHLAYITIEAITRRRIPRGVKLRIQQIGMVLLLILMAMVFYYDIFRK